MVKQRPMFEITAYTDDSFHGFIFPSNSILRPVELIIENASGQMLNTSIK